MQVDILGLYRQQLNAQPKQTTISNFQNSYNTLEPNPKRALRSGIRHQPQTKQQRINNIQDNVFLDEATPYLIYSGKSETQT